MVLGGPWIETQAFSPSSVLFPIIPGLRDIVFVHILAEGHAKMVHIKCILMTMRKAVILNMSGRKQPVRQTKSPLNLS